MSSHMYVHVPADLWALLEAHGYDEVEAPSRGMNEVASVAEAVLSAGEKGMGLTTELVGVYLARQQIGDFVNRVAAWFGLRARTPDAPRTLSFVITAGPAGAGHRVEITCPVGPDGAPALDVAALTAAVVSALDASTASGA
jgi:hypothetical protein